MKRLVLKLALGASCMVFLTACPKPKEKDVHEEKEEVASSYNYSVRIEAADDLNAAPALQSFVHAQEGDKWLLFSGRTNKTADEGGLHNLNGDYANSSFVPRSYNENLYVYNIGDNTLKTLSIDDMISGMETLAESNVELRGTLSNYTQLIPDYRSIFTSSNPQVTQDGDFLYVVGGYGPEYTNGKKDTATYLTYSQMARIHVPTMVKLISGEENKISIQDWAELFRFGTDSTFTVTGGELFIIDSTFYLAGGHNFGNSQFYVMGAHTFQLNFDNSLASLTATNIDTISDVKDSLKTGYTYADKTSQLRRRDCPIVPTLYTNSGTINEGLSFYGGVFRPRKDDSKPLTAWNTAIHIKPKSTNQIDSVPEAKYSQANYNVYSCPDFGIYDADMNEVHTFLPGGVGNGQADSALSGFTNTLGYTVLEVGTGAIKFEAIPNAFNEQYFGAEAAFLYSSDVVKYELNGEETDLIDSKKTFKPSDPNEEFMIGYIYGGIQAFEASPTTYGPGKSAASNKIWRVLVKKTAN